MRLGNYSFKASSLRDLCTSDEINKWSEFKPLNYDTNNQKITIEKTRELNLGLAPQKLNKLLTSCMDYPGEQTEYSVREILDEFKDWEYTLKPPYNQPVRYCPYRLDDFRYYVHDSVGNDIWDNVSFPFHYVESLLLLPPNATGDSYKYSYGFTGSGTFNLLYNYSGWLNREKNNANLYNPEEEKILEEQNTSYLYTDSVFDISHMKGLGDLTYWRWNVAVYIPKLKRWGLFDAPGDITDISSYESIPSIRTNIELLKILHNSGDREYTCIPVLVKKRTMSGLTLESEIYSAPSGKPFTLSIPSTNWWYGTEIEFEDIEGELEIISYHYTGFYLAFIRDYGNNAPKHLALIKKRPTQFPEYHIDTYSAQIDLTYNVLRNNKLVPISQSFNLTDFTIGSSTTISNPNSVIQSPKTIKVWSDKTGNVSYYGVIVYTWLGTSTSTEQFPVEAVKLNNMVIDVNSTNPNYNTVSKYRYSIEEFSDLWKESQNRKI